MKETLSVLQEKLRDLTLKESYEAILTLLAQYEKYYELPPNLLILKGNCIALCSAGSYTLSDVESAYREALRVDEDNIDAYLELGWFFLHVQDDAQTAQPFFERAFELSRKYLVSSLAGMNQCLAELKSTAIAEKTIEQLLRDKLGRDIVNEIAKQ